MWNITSSPEWLWAPCSVLSNGYWWLSSRGDWKRIVGALPSPLVYVCTVMACCLSFSNEELRNKEQIFVTDTVILWLTVLWHITDLILIAVYQKYFPCPSYYICLNPFHGCVGKYLYHIVCFFVNCLFKAWLVCMLKQILKYKWIFWTFLYRY
jgi:hypothetical protein